MIKTNLAIFNVLQTRDILQEILITESPNVVAETFWQSQTPQTISPKMVDVMGAIFERAFGYSSVPLSPEGLQFSSIPVPPM